MVKEKLPLSEIRMQPTTYDKTGMDPTTVRESELNGVFYRLVRLSRHSVSRRDTAEYRNAIKDLKQFCEMILEDKAELSPNGIVIYRKRQYKGPYQKTAAEDRPYKALFGKKNWSDAVMERDNYTCRCGSTSKLNAHHIKSWNKYPELRFTLDNGITLCVDCHGKEHPDSKHMAETLYYKSGKITERIEMTEERLSAALSSNGGCTKEQLACLKIEFPPKREWKTKIIGQMVRKVEYDKFLALKRP